MQSHNAVRSSSPSPRRDSKKQNLSFDSNVGIVTINTISETKPIDDNINGTTSTITDGIVENISDNGSEISDEGYRSLGLIQQANNSQVKRSSLNKQLSNEDSKKDDIKNTGKYFL